MELQKHFERQMQQILEAVSEMEGDGNISHLQIKVMFSSNKCLFKIMILLLKRMLRTII